ncbi:alpha/beta fold hydrolase [Capillimicrobium parvum]|uniref:Haloalkane dehalogenase n=1 Tax=Capillimicrobium parvum TaxID=2884022 RepID=A0A9E7BZS5_9ACTN|nr:alpha/beta hydrolase [Capillimicrobium parvum]UGS35626.1 Haloalkane dehalogenase [Capillimicrobium parvum]
MTTMPSDAPPQWAHYTEPAFADVHGLRTAYRRSGAGPAVVYLHGTVPTRVWLPLCEHLAQAHDVVAPEHPGFGDTPLPAAIEGFEDLVLHYDAFFDTLGLWDIHLVGHDLGGWIAANLAIFYPRRFASLTLITPSGLNTRARLDVPGTDPFRLTARERADALLNGRADRYSEFFTQEGFPEDVVRSYEEATTLALLAWHPRYDRRLDDRLARVAAPTLVLGAEDDRLVSGAVAERYAELIPGARHVTVRGAHGEESSHLLPLEHPREVAELAAEHVARNA